MGYVIRKIDPLSQQALEALGTVLRELRREHGLSQRVLAWRSGVHQSTISRLESGRAPGFKILALARILAGLERHDVFVPATWTEADRPGWQQLADAFSERGAFAERLRQARARRALERLDLMRPHASRGRSRIRRERAPDRNRATPQVGSGEEGGVAGGGTAARPTRS